MQKAHFEDWIYDREKYDPLDYQGFCYIITQISTGKAYIGRKYVYSSVKGKLAKESDWRSYFGSSKHLHADIEKFGVSDFRREILVFCKTRGETNQMEVELQFKNEVLRARLPNGERAFWNNSIANKWFAAKEKASDETVAKMSAAAKLRFEQSGHPCQGKTSKRGLRTRKNYRLNPRLCATCQKPIPYEKRQQPTCSRVCGGKLMVANRNANVSVEERRAFRVAQRRHKEAEERGFRNFASLEDAVREKYASGLTIKEIAAHFRMGSVKIARIINLPDFKTRREEYAVNPKACRVCGNDIPFEIRRRNNCSPECGSESSRQKRRP